MTRAFLSYAEEPGDPSHQESVLRLWEFLRSCGVDAEIDLSEAHERRDRALWVAGQIREADHVLVIASPAYRRGAEGRGSAHEERGVQWEARLIREAFYADRNALNRFVPVLLPGRGPDDVPDFLAPATSTVYTVTDFTVEGAEKLLRMLTNQPEFVRRPLGAVPVLSPKQVPPHVPPPQPPPAVRNVVTGNVSGVVIQVGNAGSVTVPATPDIRIGEGADRWTERAFENAFHRAAGRLGRAGGRLGAPAGRAYPAGPGFVQHLTGGAVICSVAGKRAVVVAGPIWDDLAALPGFPAGPGFPTSDHLDAAARTVDLDGGTWRMGILHRDPASQPARWLPKSRLSGNAREALRLPVAGPADLTVRAVATLPWQFDDDVVITPQVRELIEAALPDAPISTLLPALSLLRRARTAPARWERASGRDARYDYSLRNPAGGDTAVRAVARILLPGDRTAAVTVSVEFQANFAAWASARPGRNTADLRITANEIVALWTAAWHTATVVVPGALVPDPERATLLAPPTVELQVKADGSLPAVADLSAFGEAAGQPGPEGAVTVVAPIGLRRTKRRAWAARALTRLARAWGFADADEADERLG
ncbi:SEFIR domain-containing protein [Amycolatopsis tolypomycina]|uniref:SEFIR domain-containing protein n=1 Tax=Amycolatopsis tolypomycina TaxID=208445 RepID=A0A1H4P5W4_9PSEU|nr:SEFIR domain-containing protein [Amycolatopsis tolypomycina]SEC02759.1 SEFIR domain-containing protein [Amycolatopsis tolypomycina]